MIHGIWHASQPYVTFYCNKTKDRYVSLDQSNYKPGIYDADMEEDGKFWQTFYTFENSKVNCKDCLRVIEEEKNASIA